MPLRVTEKDKTILKEIFGHMRLRLGLGLLVASISTFVFQDIDVRIAGGIMIAGFVAGYWSFAHAYLLQKNSFSIAAFGVVVAELVFLAVRENFLIDTMPTFLIAGACAAASGFLLGHAFAAVAKHSIESGRM